MMKQMVAGFTSNSRVKEEGSDSNSSSNLYQASKRERLDNPDSSPRFKGVVLQQNGHWGAQIYAKHQRIWLGTFKSEKEAAMAYDSAAAKVRSGDSHRNFPLNDLTIEEPNFQELYSTEAILNMIKDGSYQSKFMDFFRTRRSKMENVVDLKLGKGISNDCGYSCQQLFQKELTESDVGKLNRLVIPKKHAVKYFPPITEFNSADEDVGGVDDIQLVFFDREMKSWKFRYCYWKSSQSFVFTRGWNRFVKEKQIQRTDVITFYRCENPEMPKDHQIYCMIDVERNPANIDNSTVEEPAGYTGKIMGLHLDFQGSLESATSKFEKEQEEKVVIALGPPMQEEKKNVMLFGVQIS